jgi:hypothetical protein
VEKKENSDSKQYVLHRKNFEVDARSEKKIRKECKENLDGGRRKNRYWSYTNL